MSYPTSPSFTSFEGSRRLASGPIQIVALAVKRALENGAIGPVLIFDDTTGSSIDINTTGSYKEVSKRFAGATVPTSHADSAGGEKSARIARETADSVASTVQVRGRGRPKLGVVAREVTLLPRHWEWLATQPGGASVALRKLVEQARKTHAERDKSRQAQERTYHFMSAMAGDLAGFEEAARALFRDDRPRFTELIAAWPDDVRDHTIRLAGSGDTLSLPATD